MSDKPNLHHSQSFASAFWSPDYLTGLAVLFDKLDQGVAENAQVVSFITARIALESAYANSLQSAALDNDSSRLASQGFNRDEGASLKQGFQSFLDESRNQGIQHAHIAANLERLVRGPFSQYAASHKKRVTNARASITTIAKDYQKAVSNVAKTQQTYFAKARQLEDNVDPSSGSQSIHSSPLRNSLTLDAPAPEEQPKQEPTIDLAGTLYTPAKLAPLLSSMLYSVPKETMRFSILGSYENVSVGEDIVLWVRKYLSLKSLGEAEKFGQGLVDNGFLRLVGSVGSRFSGSTNSKYQWLPKAMEYSQESSTSDSSQKQSDSALACDAVSPKGHRSTASISKLTRVSGYISGFLPTATDEEDTTKVSQGRESQMLKLQREISDVDQQYKEMVTSLDLQRCKLELAIEETLTFMQQCERDRVKAVKTVLRDFGASVAKTIDGMNDSVARMSLHEQLIDPLKDLDYLIERYKTGHYAPKPVVYDNFFNASKVQTFGVDLKHSAYFIPSCIEFLTSPIALAEDDKSTNNTLRGDEEDVRSEKSDGSDASDRTAVYSQASSLDFPLAIKFHGLSENSKEILAQLWAAPQSPLSEIQALRTQINTGKEFDPFEAFSGVPLQVVISTLKEYLLELPDSIVTSTVYDIIKATYATNQTSETTARVDRLVGLITHMPRVNLAALQILLAHLAEICGLPETGSVEEVPEALVTLSRALAPYILRPRTTTSLTMTDRHPRLFLQDLIVHRVHIFEELATRLNAGSRTTPMSKHANRRSQIEARNRAIQALTQGTTAANKGEPAAVSASSPRSPSPVTSGKLLPLTLSPAARLTERRQT